MSLHDLIFIAPFALLGLGALIVLLLGVLPGENNGQLPYIGSIIVLLLTMFQVAGLFGEYRRVEHFIEINHLVLIAFEFLAAGGLACVLLAKNYPALNRHVGEEFYALILIAVLGGFLLVASVNLLSTFIGMETIAIPMFALVAWHPARQGAIEGAVKYAITATIAAAFLLLGIGLIYFGSGTLIIDQIPARMAQPHALPILVYLGVIFLFVGVAFELALAPFHAWLADVYQAAPAPVMAFIGSVAKIAMLFFLIHFALQIEPIWSHFSPVLWILVVVSIVLGNLLALRQNNIKRILAYSAVAQFGYVLMALASVNPNNIESMHYSTQTALYYGISYGVMNMVAFAIIAIFNKHNPTGELSKYKGLGRRYPLAGIAMVIAVLSLAGIPPTSGFFAKFLLFSDVLHNGLLISHGYLGFVLLAALGSAVSVFYYLRILLAFFAKEDPMIDSTISKSVAMKQGKVMANTLTHQQVNSGQNIDFGATLVIGFCAIATLGLGILAQYVFQFMG